MPRELRLSEHFVSPQGEGPRTGVMTQFIRFAGCNMRCPGWPCDTQYAILPEIWRHDSYMRAPEELASDVWDRVATTGASAINLTGGEPFQQPNHLLEKFVARLTDVISIECFSNGSFIYPQWALDRIDFVMDWKLEGSGEAATKREERTVNAYRFKPSDAIKFVVTGVVDLQEAQEVWRWLKNDTPAQFWVGAAWGLYKSADIVEYVKKYQLPWCLNVQVHNYIYNPQERGR